MIIFDFAKSGKAIVDHYMRSANDPGKLYPAKNFGDQNGRIKASIRGSESDSKHEIWFTLECKNKDDVDFLEKLVMNESSGWQAQEEYVQQYAKDSVILGFENNTITMVYSEDRSKPFMNVEFAIYVGKFIKELDALKTE